MKYKWVNQIPYYKNRPIIIIVRERDQLQELMLEKQFNNNVENVEEIRSVARLGVREISQEYCELKQMAQKITKIHK